MRGIVSSFILWIAAAGIAWPAAVPAVTLRDDLGERIASPLEVCFQSDLRGGCVNLAAGDGFAPPDRLRSLRIEGPDHGPASFQAGDLEAGEDGRLVLRVPRKALLRIDKLPAEPLNVAVYDPGAASFDKPWIDARMGPAGLRIPAGELLVALSEGRKAPDLHRLAVQPGAVAHLEYQSHDGWSLVVRSRGAKTGKPVAAAVVSLESVPGYGAPNRPAGEETTEADGLALFPGLAGRRIDAGVRHSEFLPQRVPGLSAAPGALVFREVDLEKGGRVRARVRVKGQPVGGAYCRMVDLRPPDSPDVKEWTPKRLYSGRTSWKGICWTHPLPAGSYLLDVRLTKTGAPLQRNVTVVNDGEVEEEFDFSEIKVSGTVTRGGEPAPGFTVSVMRSEAEPEIRLEVAQATSGKDGTYEVTLAEPGLYFFSLRATPEARSIMAERRETVKEAGKQRVDFSLERASIRGKVVDDQRKAVAQAGVKLRWRAWDGADDRYTRTDERGEFEFLLPSEGKGDVEVRKQGYRHSELQEVALEGHTEPPPLLVVLAKEKLFRGTLSSVAGLPVAGGWVASSRGRLGDDQIPYRDGRTDAEGRFEVAPVEGERNRLFASGPGCPLSSFDPADANGELALRCQGRPAVLDLTLTDTEGRPVPAARVILRQGGVIIPRPLLAFHLSFLGLSAATDATGRLVVPNLAPGDYDVFVASSVEEGMIEAGSRTGYLATAHLSPLATAVLRLTVGGRL